MRSRGMMGLIVVVGAILACGVVSMAQRTEAKRWRGTMALPIGDGTIALPVDGKLEAKDAPTRQAESLAGDDPMGAVDAFLGRNRKEADESIKALTREAEALRARLQKVEAALARWQEVANALSQPTPSPIAPPNPEPTQLEAIPQPPSVEVPTPRSNIRATRGDSTLLPEVTEPATLALPPPAVPNPEPFPPSPK